ncbi:hypothetical protein WLQ65_15515 [Pseudoalteromonas piscicida]|uniref:hypothetical protein n=1 Tax=Pseudoalteromonas piscicida TaxID=43662 RepID=UPI0030C9D399
MKLSWFFLMLFALGSVLLSYVHMEVNNYVNIALLVSIVALSLIAKGQENIKHVSVLLLLVTVAEYFLNVLLLSMREQGLAAHLTNTYIFGGQLVFDILVLMVLKRRVYWSLRYVRRTNPDNWRAIYMTHADPLLYGIFFAFVLVDLAAFGENIIRNLEHLGVDEAFAKQFWSWGLIYNNYEILKSILLSCVITTLLATIFVERQRPAEAEPEFEAKP